jgi:hypothetical protein
LTESGSGACRWCHGAPAIVILLASLLTRDDVSTYICPERRQNITAALDIGSALIYERGFLRKGVGLCHGAGGSIFALISASHAYSTSASSTGSDTSGKASLCLRQTTHLALLAVDWKKLASDGAMTQPDRPWSLYKRLAGMCAAWAAVIQALDGENIGGMPGYDDLR